MPPAGQPLHAIPPGWPGPAHWLRGWAPMRSASTTRARSATSLDPQHGVVVMETWRQCIRSIVCNTSLQYHCFQYIDPLSFCVNCLITKYSPWYLHCWVNTVEPHYNEVLGTMKITLLYQVSHYIRVKKQRNIKSWDQQNYLVIRGFCYIRPLYNEVPL